MEKLGLWSTIWASVVTQTLTNLCQPFLSLQTLLFLYSCCKTLLMPTNTNHPCAASGVLEKGIGAARRSPVRSSVWCLSPHHQWCYLINLWLKNSPALTVDAERKPSRSSSTAADEPGSSILLLLLASLHILRGPFITSPLTGGSKHPARCRRGNLLCRRRRSPELGRCSRSATADGAWRERRGGGGGGVRSGRSAARAGFYYGERRLERGRSAGVLQSAPCSPDNGSVCVCVCVCVLLPVTPCTHSRLYCCT